MLLPFFYNGLVDDPANDLVTRTSAIYLVGLMGVGKSTVGARLAQRLGRIFIDTDQEVERKANRTIAEIFEADGEARFRELEAEAIRAAEMDGAVIALGGGAVAEPGAIERLLESGEVIFLSADPAVLIRRIGDPESRPKLAGLDRAAQIETLAALLEERLPFYRKAGREIDADGDVNEVVDRILDELSIG
ncbi:MAG TPA: shikimate kinase [Myxococcales bacterium]|nr:shikimate kinase [Myxococcales bacterium]HIK83595.1 shikimate kinase [Myxococcales bacterium]